MRVNGSLLLLIISKICLNQVFTMSIFATMGVGHYLDDPIDMKVSLDIFA